MVSKKLESMLNEETVDFTNKTVKFEGEYATLMEHMVEVLDKPGIYKPEKKKSNLRKAMPYLAGGTAAFLLSSLSVDQILFTLGQKIVDGHELISPVHYLNLFLPTTVGIAFLVGSKPKNPVDFARKAFYLAGSIGLAFFIHDTIWYPIMGRPIPDLFGVWPNLANAEVYFFGLKMNTGTITTLEFYLWELGLAGAGLLGGKSINYSSKKLTERMIPKRTLLKKKIIDGEIGYDELEEALNSYKWKDKLVADDKALTMFFNNKEKTKEERKKMRDNYRDWEYRINAFIKKLVKSESDNLYTETVS